MYHILILEDHPMMVGPIKASVQGLPFKSKVFAASRLIELQTDTRFATFAPHLIVADLNLPDSKGLATLEALQAQYPTAQILVFSQIDDVRIEAQVLKLGAYGYVSKSQPPKVFVERLHQALGDIQQQSLTPNGYGRAMDAVELDPVDAAMESLTLQQRKVLVALASGRTNDAMALQLEISEATIRTHLTEIFQKLKVKNRSQAIVCYLHWASQHEV